MQKISKIVAVCLLVASGFFTASAFAVSPPLSESGEPLPPQVEQSEDGRVSINQASAEELAMALNGIGLKKAQGIVNYRQQYGAFTHVEQLQEVPGIGAAILERNLDKIRL